MEVKESSFVSEIKQVQKLLSQKDAEIQKLYELVEAEGKVTQAPWDGKTLNPDRLCTILQQIGLKSNKDNRLAFLSRLINLREDSLSQSWKKAGHSDESIETFQEITYKFVREFRENYHKQFIANIVEKDLLTKFYQTVLIGWGRIGEIMSQWQSDWTKTILYQTNKELAKEFDDDSVAVNNYLEENNLKDLGHWGKLGDRCYSVLLRNEQGEWASVTYSNAFPKHVQNICNELQNLIDELQPLTDEVYHEKEAWINYLNSLIQAFGETEPNQCIDKWADVDRMWMKITGMIQPGHPLEYYEDHFRKAVALEWDIRLSNPEHYTEGIRKRKIENFANSYFDKSEMASDSGYREILDFCTNKLESVQLHIGSMATYYGAGFMGLPSAQVVPNDEMVSKECGKKIFAFPDDVIQAKRSRPFLRFTREIFGQEFLTRQRQTLFQNEDLWFHIYDISTIGHEYGHILWVDQDTEALMDARNGNFKNVEEWKATTGGLMAFFEETNAAWDEKQAVIEELVARSVGLLAWRETSEVLPYYIEGHIHLKGLFDCGILNWEQGSPLTIVLDEERYQKLKAWYNNTYTKLVRDFYLPKKDPTPFLKEFVQANKSKFDAKDAHILDFQNYFWNTYRTHGQEIDTEDHPDNYR